MITCCGHLELVLFLFLSLFQDTMTNSKKSKHERGIVYFSHLPHGFYEKELRSFLSQFGTITNLRLGRSQKTGQSRGYAFVEFLYTDVAKIVVETMNNYLMFEKLLKCQLISPEKANDAIFKGKVDPARPPALVNRLKAKKQVNANRTEKQDKNAQSRRMASLKKLKAKLSLVGVTPKMKKLKSRQTTPIMEIDEDEEIALKTPPNVKKVRSRPNSAAVTPKSKPGTPK
eukprot:14700.XXX_418567_419316_1 [CDS] Oithona nana genome sequencing.